MDNPEKLSLNIGDTEIDYLYYNGEGPTLIMLHATGFVPWLWHPIARELSDSYRIIAPYFCSHRQQEPENKGISWFKLAQDLKTICEKLDAHNPIFVGHSMGAAVITIASAVLDITPSKMVLFEPIFLPRELYEMDITVEQHPFAAKSIKRRNHWEDDREARDYLKSKSLFKVWDPEMIDLYVRYGMKACKTGGLQLACSPENEAALFLGSRHFDPWPVLPDVLCPVRVVAGGQSDIRPFIKFEKASSMFPKGSYTLINDVGHLIPMEKPRTCIRIIKDFI